MTVALPPLPLPLRAANRVAARLGRAVPSLDPDALVARARRRTGLPALGAPAREEPAPRARAALGALHDRLDPAAPEEEVPLVARSFLCPMFNIACELPAYDAWLAARPHAAWLEVYAYHRRQLELAHAAGPPGPFVLKSPVHTMGLAALLEVYPDALVVHTERDPADIAASFLG